MTRSSSLSSRGSTSGKTNPAVYSTASSAQSQPPHDGCLCECRDVSDGSTGPSPTIYYRIEIFVKQEDSEGTDADESQRHPLRYTKNDFEFAQRLFAILDTESRGRVDRASVKEFVTLRCPVFWRRDDDLRRLNLLDSNETESTSPTFDEIWQSVEACSTSRSQISGCQSTASIQTKKALCTELGLEGWMVFCRYIALAQYLEAKRRFSARHLQQTMKHRNAPRGSELVVVDVPPLEPPAPLSPLQLARYEQQNKAPLPVPELDLDHSLVAAHECFRRLSADRAASTCSRRGLVKVSLFGSPTFSTSTLLHSPAGSSSRASSKLEFALTYTRRGASTCLPPTSTEETVVRRTMADMKWLNDTFSEHKVLGGTLCGRILPPFPGQSTGVLSSHFQGDESVLNSSLKTTGDVLSAAAVSGVGKLRSAAKSLLGGYLVSGGSSNGPEDSNLNTSGEPSRKPSPGGKNTAVVGGRIYADSYYNPNSPHGRARQLERYLNYLLEHPALSTSFPLNAILMASQSGLEAAKESLEEIRRSRKELVDQTPQLDNNRVDASSSPNLAWVRTAAQAAVALQVHGMLETTGMNSASARLQHASLPSFGASARSSGWDDDDRNSPSAESRPNPTLTEEAPGADFEDGVVSVHSALNSEDQNIGDEGYDLLPLPVPAPERTILSAGSSAQAATCNAVEERYHYGPGAIETLVELDNDERARKAFLGDIAVDDNIDKLREVIGSVDNTLSRCLTSIGGIGKAQRERQSLHLDVVRGLDSWTGMRGKFVSQRPLLKGVAGIEQSKEIYEEGGIALVDDISWQTSLASSAVAASEDVRSAVRVCRTAANAKAAASSAAYTAQQACETGTFASIDEARAAQTRASIAQSHAIHAAVVEHEAKTVKRRATLALAHDVKCWNVHRKREMLLSCISYARSQHEATRRAVDAWSSLRDGFIGAPLVPSTSHGGSSVALSGVESTPVTVEPSVQASRVMDEDFEEATATIYRDVAIAATGGTASIVAVAHQALDIASIDEAVQPEKERAFENSADTPFHSDMALPFATAAPIPEEGGEDVASMGPGGRVKEGCRRGDRGRISRSTSDIDRNGDGDEKLSSSMQSLIDGLMSWGGQEAEEDHFALPEGMAASIAYEESAALGASSVSTRTPSSTEIA